MGRGAIDRSNRKLIAIFATVLVVCFAVLLIIFNSLIGRYRSNITYDSASHLVEINHQVRSFIEGTITDDQRFAASIATNIDNNEFTDQSELLAYLKTQKEIWGIESIRVYTADGLCYDQDGIAQNRDKASEFAYQVVKTGEQSSIINSMMEYGVPANSSITMDGQQIVAISVVRDLTALIDGLDLQSFSGQGYLYLTQQNGIKVSQSTNKNAPVVFNASALFETGTLICLSADETTLENSMTAGDEAVYLYTDRSDTATYVVATPVGAIDETWYLFYLVPEATVNQTMNSFVNYTSMLTVAVMLVFLLLFLAFVLVYRARTKRYMTDVRERERLFDLLVSDTDTAFLLLSDKNRKPLYVSSNAERVLGTPNPIVAHDNGGLRLGGSDGVDSHTIACINAALASWDGVSEFVSDYIPYGEKREPRYMVLRLYPVHGQPDEYVGIAQDVTEERRREEELRNALVMADSANHAKTRFLSNMSHDIRTPMNAIVNMTRFAITDIDSPTKVRDYLDTIQGSSEHLLQLINDVLDMSRIESGEMVFSSEPFDIAEVLKNICEIIYPLCANKGQMLSCDWDTITHRHLIGDPLRLHQILINILNNAVKFTPEGGHIDLLVSELHALKEGTANFRFVVKDNGIGMDKDTISHIFDPFVRGDADSVQTTEGSGLGLSITKNFIDALGGGISVESTPGEGSTFTVELFFTIDADASGREETPEQPTDFRFDGMRALLAEDNPTNQTIACIILESWGFAVDVAEDGEEALSTFTEHEGQPYDIIFMDIQMPNMDGYAATAAIRASSVTNASTVPIVAMTANVFAEDIEKARQSGMDGHVGKPIDPNELRLITARLLGKTE